MALACPIAERLEAAPALAVEDWLRDSLAGARSRDAAAGSAAIGAHRTDMVLADAATGVPAALACTGEQKALLIGVILRHAALIAEARGFAPLLLLDEPAVHLDPDRRAALFAALVRTAGADPDHRHRRRDVPAARRHRRRPACAWRRIAAGSAFSAAGIDRYPCAGHAVAAIYLEYPTASGVARRHVRRHRAAA